MTILKMPNRHTMSQVNRKRDWQVGIVSPEDGTPVKADTDRRVIYDDKGNVIPMSGLAGNRPWQLARRWLRQNFNIPGAVHRVADPPIEH